MNLNSLTDKKTFDNFKGILILVIIYGHIQQAVSPDIDRMLAIFNVSLFFILPFLFNKDTLNLTNITKVFRRYYMVFMVFLILTSVIYAVLYSHNFNIIAEFFKVAVIGSNPLIKDLVGSSYLWFLPALISTILLIMFYNSIKYKKSFLVVTLIVHLCLTFIDIEILYLFPLNSAISLYIFILGVLVSYLYKNHLEFIYKIRLYLFSLLIVLLYLYYGTSYWYTIIQLPNITNIYELVLFDSIQVLAFFMLLFVSSLINNKYLRWLGHRSLIVYTIHPLIIFALNYIHGWNGIIEGIIKLTIVISLSFLAAYILEYTKLTRFIYPR